MANHKAAIFLANATASLMKNGGDANGGGGPISAFYGPGHFLVAPTSVNESNGALESDFNRQADAKARIGQLDNEAFEVGALVHTLHRTI